MACRTPYTRVLGTKRDALAPLQRAPHQLRVPAVVDGCCRFTRLLHILQALNKRSGPFTANDEQHLQLVGVHLGNTLAKSRFYEEAKREKARLATLSKCFRRLSAVVS